MKRCLILALLFVAIGTLTSFTTKEVKEKSPPGVEVVSTFDYEDATAVDINTMIERQTHRSYYCYSIIYNSGEVVESEIAVTLVKDRNYLRKVNKDIPAVGNNDYGPVPINRGSENFRYRC